MPGLDTVPGTGNDPNILCGSQGPTLGGVPSLDLGFAAVHRIAKPSVSGTPESRVYTIHLGGC